MKRTFLTVATLVVGLFAMAQTCPEYYPIHEGAMWEQQRFDAKDKLESTDITRVVSVTPTPGGYEAVLENTSTNPKEEGTYTSQLVYRCENGVLFFDMSSLTDPSSLEAYQGMDMKVESTGMQYPSVLAAGTTLPDASISITVSNSGFQVFSMSVQVSNRKVEANESITVPAGTFQATKISYTVNSKIAFVKVQSSVVEWISPSAGIVRNETYDKKGKLMGYSVLSKLVK